MVAAFYKSGLEPWVITVSDLIERRVDEDQVIANNIEVLQYKILKELIDIMILSQLMQS